VHNPKPLSADAAASSKFAQSHAFDKKIPAKTPFQRTAELVNATIATGRSNGLDTPRAVSPKKVAAEKILQSFNTWAFKREQPDNPLLMQQLIAQAAQSNKPISFVLYWGKGPKVRIGGPEVTCLDYLGMLARRVRDEYATGAALTLIFTDTHAQLNGHTQQSAQEYFGSVEAAARARGFGVCWLSELVMAAQAAGVSEISDITVPEDTLQRLGKCAAKWYRGDGTAEEAALNYFRMNMVEKQAVELAFPQSIFVTFNGSDFRCLFPERLPIFYMYSLKRGVSAKPWFLLDATKTSNTE
jgi:hypothetical protein